MAIQDIKQTELTQSEREVLEEDRARWKRMGAGGHLDEWLPAPRKQTEQPEPD